MVFYPMHLSSSFGHCSLWIDLLARCFNAHIARLTASALYFCYVSDGNVRFIRSGNNVQPGCGQDPDFPPGTINHVGNFFWNCIWSNRPKGMAINIIIGRLGLFLVWGHCFVIYIFSRPVLSIHSPRR